MRQIGLTWRSIVVCCVALTATMGACLSGCAGTPVVSGATPNSYFVVIQYPQVDKFARRLGDAFEYFAARDSMIPIGSRVEMAVYDDKNSNGVADSGEFICRQSVEVQRTDVVILCGVLPSAYSASALRFFVDVPGRPSMHYDGQLLRQANPMK